MEEKSGIKPSPLKHEIFEKKDEDEKEDIPLQNPLNPSEKFDPKGTLLVGGYNKHRMLTKKRCNKFTKKHNYKFFSKNDFISF